MANPSNFQVTPFSRPIENTEINFSNLYLHQIYSGANTNQSRIVTGDAGTEFGLTAVNNWAIYEGLGKDAKLVALAKGMHMNIVDWYNSFIMVFNGERFKGSTLEVMGATIEGLGDWAIVGGTGAFEFARGVIKRKVYAKDNGKEIYELTIRGICLMKELAIKRGPWGNSNVGSVLDIKELPARLESVTICHWGIVDSLSFTYIDNYGKKQTIGPWGEKWAGDKNWPAGDKIDTLNLGPSEIVKEVSGRFFDNAGRLYSLTFVTNLNHTYGPFGGHSSYSSPTGPSFKYKADDMKDSCIVGFYGRINEKFNSFGVYTI